MKLNGPSVADVLRVEGTNRYEVLTYLLFPAGSDMPSTVATCRSMFDGASNTTLTPLVSDAWRAEVVVAETTLNDPPSILQWVAEALRRALESPGCFGAICMFDGAFFSFDDILSPETAEQTYAFSIQEGTEVICMSTEVLTSEGWSEIVKDQRRALEPVVFAGS